MLTLPDQLLTPAETVTGRGVAASLLARCAAIGGRGLLVHGRSLDAGGHLARILSQAPADVDVETWCTPGGEPTLTQLDEVRRLAAGVAWVVGIGGGSVMDLAKAAAGLAHVDATAEACHDGAEICAPGLPFVAVPTTAGSGSEATIVAVLTNAARGVKKSIRHPSFMPVLVLLDADLMAGSPAQVIAHSGMDALTQAIESYTSRHATWYTRALARRGIELINGAIESTHADPGGAGAEAMLVGSYLTGVAFSSSRLGVVHGLAHPLGVRYHISHGLLCGICLPHALAYNREAMGAQYDELAACMGADPQARVEALLAAFGMASPLAGATLCDEAAMIEEILASGSTRANPRTVTPADAADLLAAMFRA